MRLFTHSVSGGFYAEGFLNRSTHFYVNNTAPSAIQDGEPVIELTRPDPSVGFWQRAWSTRLGMVPSVIDGQSPRVVTGRLPGPGKELVRHATSQALQWPRVRGEGTGTAGGQQSADQGPGDGPDLNVTPMGIRPPAAGARGRGGRGRGARGGARPLPAQNQQQPAEHQVELAGAEGGDIPHEPPAPQAPQGDNAPFP